MLGKTGLIGRNEEKERFSGAAWVVFFQAERAQRSFLSGGLRLFFLENVFTGGRGLNGGLEPLPEFLSPSPQSPTGKCTPFPGSICLTASECFPIFIYSSAPAGAWQSGLFVTAHVH